MNRKSKTFENITLRKTVWIDKDDFQESNGNRNIFHSGTCSNPIIHTRIVIVARNILDFDRLRRALPHLQHKKNVDGAFPIVQI